MAAAEKRIGTGKPGPGRPKGSQDKRVKMLAAIVDKTLFDDPEVTAQRLIRLRDSEDPSEQKIYWQLAGKRLPNMVEANVKSETVVRIIDLSDEGK